MSDGKKNSELMGKGIRQSQRNQGNGLRASSFSQKCQNQVVVADNNHRTSSISVQSKKNAGKDSGRVSGFSSSQGRKSNRKVDDAIVEF